MGADDEISSSRNTSSKRHDHTVDSERRFGALRRLYGDAGYARLRGACIAVIGLGGVGSWTAEALARSGVARLVLVDMDHIAESNINRQVQATTPTLGQHKGEALRERIQGIHPGCDVLVIDDFVSAENWPRLWAAAIAPATATATATTTAMAKATASNEVLTPQVLVDACDQVQAKVALVTWSLQTRVPVVCVGAAGGKQQAQMVDVQDLADTTHDPLLASLRQRLRKDGVAPRAGGGRMGVRCVFSKEAVMAPRVSVRPCATRPQAFADEATANDGATSQGATNNGAANDATLNCHGYGSSVTVTATFGMVAAGEAIAQLLALPTSDPA
jgi:tRNA threonylcarbamoyladenosine dehydratase